MLKIGLIGFGFMGRMHFDNYVRLAGEGKQVKVVAICDVAIETLKNAKAGGNMATAQETYDLSGYALYDSVDKMLANEELDMIDITLPTTLHADLTCELLEKGYHVFCEKPMARRSDEARRMVETAERTGRKLQIGQCLRFWPAYEYLKASVEDGRYGAVKGGYFYRGSHAPAGWFLNGDLSGGALLDMHIHDTDIVNWLFGKPERVSTIGRNVIPGSGFDVASTHYGFADGKVVNAQVDWTLEGDFGFEMGFRVNFDGANIILGKDGLTVNPKDAAGFQPELAAHDGYYGELLSFTNAILSDEAVSVCTPESTLATLEIVEAEQQSAERGGEWVKL
ncbi:Gfo/Idh/MocA family protein [Cohnella sp. GCM10012308]|uniref:Gfo/Idh/MocA family protein n=1 Tax=Cohnella sp. GCM10012308 TaxID=3317329 RepID=UPI00361866FC